MKNARLRTLLIGLTAGVLYAFLSMLVVYHFHQDVSITYIFVLPVILGALPVLFSTKEQLEAYKTYLIMPWVVTFTFFVLSFVTGFEGMICLVIIVGPFLVLGSLGAFVFKLIKLKSSGKGTKLYFSLFLPVVVLVFETGLQPSDKTYTVSTNLNLYSRVWADFILDDFHEMILEVIKARCENK